MIAVDIAARGLARRALAGAPLTPHDFGAAGDGVTSDQAALEAAIEAARQQGTDAPGLYVGETAGNVHLPPGSYLMSEVIELIANEAGWANLHLTAAPGTVRIIVPDGQYAFESAEITNSIYVDGIIFQGGKGAFRRTADVNVNAFQVFRNCLFLDYTECAVASNSSDQPYWRFIDCFFAGAPNCNTRAIALTGLVDELRIVGCTFVRDQHHLVLGPVSSAAYICFNSFLSFANSNCEADIVIVPNQTANSYGNSSANGMLFGWNKFGNENLKATSPRVLFAMLNADGSGIENNTVSTAWTTKGTGSDAGKNYLRGLQFKGNAFYADGGYVAPLIRSYVDEVGRVLFDDDNVFVSGQWTYLVEWMGPHRYDYTLPWDVRLADYGLDSAYGLPFSLGVSNCPMGPIKAPALSGGAQVPHGPLGCNEASLAYCESSGDWATNAGSTMTAAIGPRGTSNAAEVTAAGNGSAQLYKPFDATGHTDRHCWLILQLARHPEQPVKRVRVQVFNFADVVLAYDRYHVLDDVWGQICEGIVIPATASPGSWQLRITPVDYAAGTGDKFLVGNLHIHTGSSPMPAAPSAYQPNPVATYVAPSGGTTVDAEGRAAIGQLAADNAALRSAVNALLAQGQRDGRMKLA